MIFPEKINSNWQLTRIVNFIPGNGHAIIADEADGELYEEAHIVEDDDDMNITVPPTDPNAPTSDEG